MNIPHPILRDAATGGTGGGGAAGSSTGAASGAAGGVIAAGAAGTAVAGTAGGAAAAATPDPFYKGLYGDDGKIDKKALDRLPDHLKGYKDVFGKYETVDALLSGFGNVHTLAMKKAMAPLDPTAPPEVVAERKAHLDQINNVPKDVKGYGIAKPDDLDAMFWNAEGADKFGAVAQKHSISPAAVKELLGLQLELTRGEIARGQQMETEFYSKQQDAFNAAVAKQGMDPEKAKNLVDRGALNLGIDAKSPILKNAEVRLACIRHANLVGEDRLITGEATAGAVKNPIEQARDIMQNPQNPDHKAWHDPLDPRHESVMAKWNELYRSAPAVRA